MPVHALQRSSRPLFSISLRVPAVACIAAFKPCLYGSFHSTRIARFQEGSNSLKVEPIHGETVPRDIDEFEALAKEGRATIDIAQEYLQLSKDRAADLPYQARAREAAKARAARILLWIWTKGGQDTREKDISRPFLNLLCWHLEAQGLQDYLWKWLDAEIERLKDTPGKEKNWLGRVLASLITVMVQWHPENNPDPGIKAFLHAMERFEGRDRDMRWAALITAMRQILMQTTTVPCSEDLFDDFIETMWLNGGPMAQVRHMQAYPRLFHPTRPDALSLLQHLQHVKEHPGALPMPSSPAGIRSLAGYMLRASYILRCQGRADDALWLEKQIRHDDPSTWSRRFNLKHAMDRDLKLANVRSQAVDAETLLREAWDLKRDRQR